ELWFVVAKHRPMPKEVFVRIRNEFNKKEWTSNRLALDAPGKDSDPLPGQPFAIVRKGGQSGPAGASLADAVMLAQSGDTIEIRGNGPLRSPRIDLADRALFIRAGAGFRPVLQLEDAAPSINAFLVTRAPLFLEGLKIRPLRNPPADPKKKT